MSSNEVTAVSFKYIHIRFPAPDFKEESIKWFNVSSWMCELSHFFSAVSCQAGSEALRIFFFNLRTWFCVEDYCFAGLWIKWVTSPLLLTLCGNVADRVLSRRSSVRRFVSSWWVSNPRRPHVTTTQHVLVWIPATPHRFWAEWIFRSEYIFIKSRD